MLLFDAHLFARSGPTNAGDLNPAGLAAAAALQNGIASTAYLSLATSLPVEPPFSCPTQKSLFQP